MMLGIFLADLFRQGKTAYLIAFLIVLVILIFVALFKFVFKNKFFNTFGKYLKSFAIVFVATAVGAVLFYGVFSKISGEEKVEINETSSYFVMATVKSTPSKNNGVVSLFVKDMKLSGSNDEFYQIDNFNMYVKISSEDFKDEAQTLFDAHIGDKVMFHATIRNIDVFDGSKVFSYAYKNDARYFAYLTYGTVSVIDGQMGFLDSVRNHIKQVIYSAMDERQAGLAYAVFVGDQSGLDEEIQENFRLTGLAHLLAVSGINVTIMMVAIMWLFEKLKLKPQISFVIVILVILIYCVLCDFTASVLRAGVMTIFLMFGKVFGKQTDPLNSVSLAGVLFLLIEPMFAFDLSFILSFASVFGMILLYAPIYEGLLKLKLGKFVSASLAISISAQVATLPFLINSFGYFSIISLLANFVIGPIFEYTYIVFFVTLLLNLIMPFLWFLQWFAQWGYWLVDWISSWMARLPITTVGVSSLSNVFSFVLFVMMFTLSRYNVSGTKAKVITNSGLAVLLVLTIIFNTQLLAVL